MSDAFEYPPSKPTLSGGRWQCTCFCTSGRTRRELDQTCGKNTVSDTGAIRTDQGHVIPRVDEVFDDAKHIPFCSAHIGCGRDRKVIGCRCEGVDLGFAQIIGIEVDE